MKCIDAVEGAIKSIIIGLHQVSVENRLDDTEYIRNVKAVIDATDIFMQDNREIASEPQILKEVLYLFSKNLWLKKIHNKEPASDDEDRGLEDDEYCGYYYDHIYNHGVYPR